MILKLDEMDRQLVLLALAHLSDARPGWDEKLNEIATRIDLETRGRAVLFDEFRLQFRRQRAEQKAG